MAFVGTLLVAVIQGARPFYGDSIEYWSLGHSFTQNGHFSLFNFQSSTRGYTFPLIIHVIQALARDVHLGQGSAATLFNILVFALIGAVLVPRLAQSAWPDQDWGILRRVASMALLLIFWSGDLNYPMSDFPGLAAALLALVAVSHSSPRWMLIGGIAGGMAFDIRPAYLAFAPALLIVAALTSFAQRGPASMSIRRRVLCVSMVIVGFAVISLPQSLVTHRHFGTWSFVPGAPINLGLQKLNAGMEGQRADAYEPPGVPSAILYRDETSERLLKELPEAKIKSFSQYVGLFITHPVVMVAVLVRRLVNGVDVRYSTMFVEHLDSGGHLWLRLPGFLLAFFALVRLLWRPARLSLGRARWQYPIALALCCLTILTQTVETRYMLPVYMLIYMLVLAPGWPSPIDMTQPWSVRFRLLMRLAIACVIFMAVVWHIVGSLHGEIIQ